MRTKHILVCAVLAASAIGIGEARAQAPAVGGAGAGAGAANGTAATAATAAAAEAKPGFFKKCCDALEECKRKLCKTAAGQLLNSMTAPVSAMTGGVIPSFCPIMPSAKDLLKEGTEGAAANAKKDALEAKERVKAVRYLGTLDCRYYPEAEMALIAALRMDRVECVRWEAALAFGRGCCCTKKVMEALEISVSGSDRDGNPDERSPRVREAAAFALDRCLACYQEPLHEVEDIKDKDPSRKDDGTPGKVEKERQMIERARNTMANYSARREMIPASAMASQSAVLPKGQRSLYHIIRYGAEGSDQPVAQPISPQLARNVPQSAGSPRALPRIDSSSRRPTPYGEHRENLQPLPTGERKDAVDNLQPVPSAERKDVVSPQSTVANSSPANVMEDVVPPPQPQEPARSATMAPPEKPAMPMVNVEPMDPTPSPEVKVQPEVKAQPEAKAQPDVKAQSEMRVESPAAPATTVQPAPQAAPAPIAKPDSDENVIGGQIDAMLTGTTANDRHMAIRAIIAQDWRKHPQIVAALVKTARLDSDRAVRVDAIRHLAHLKIDVPYVFDHLKYMEKDADSWIQQESTLALEKLGR
jgi:hypothetical protein